MSKHTPSPWYGKSIRVHAKFFERYKTSIEFAHYVDHSSKEIEANCNLIMAAPELLEALDYTASLLEASGRTALTARQAIAKAKGGI